MFSFYFFFYLVGGGLKLNNKVRLIFLFRYRSKLNKPFEISALAAWGFVQPGFFASKYRKQDISLFCKDIKHAYTKSIQLLRVLWTARVS